MRRYRNALTRAESRLSESERLALEWIRALIPAVVVWAVGVAAISLLALGAVR